MATSQSLHWWIASPMTTQAWNHWFKSPKMIGNELFLFFYFAVKGIELQALFDKEVLSHWSTPQAVYALFSVFCVSVGGGVQCVSHDVMWRSECSLVGVGFLLPSRGFWGLTTGHQACNKGKVIRMLGIKHLYQLSHFACPPTLFFNRQSQVFCFIARRMLTHAWTRMILE